MSLRKPRISNKITSLFKKALILGTVSLFIVATVPPKQTSAHHAQECSDVFTPLSSTVVTGVNNNKAFYMQAMNETNVPWEMLAAIHYRETNFSHTNPSNGQGIFQFVNGEGGPYPAGPVNDAEFYRQLKFMAQKIQNDYVNRGSVARERRKLQPYETNMALVKDTLFSYNGRAAVYADQAGHFGFNTTNQPYEGSPYVMNRFDCQRARMGLITQDYGSMDGIDTRYGTFTLFARLRGDNYWRQLLPFYTEEINMSDAQRRIETLEFNSRIYTFYYDGLQQVLRMATQDPTYGWQFTILDGTATGGNGRIYANIGGSLTATVFQGNIHLFYFDKTNGNLRHAWSPNGTSWSFENLDGDRGSRGGVDAEMGMNPSVTVWAGTLQVAYPDKTNGNLRHAWSPNGTSWSFENLDGDRGSVISREGTVGLFTAIAAYGDSIQVFYYDQVFDNLRHAWASTTHGWRFEDFDGGRAAISGTDGDFGLSPSVTKFGDSIQVFYYDRTHSDVRHAWANSQHGWRFEDLDGDGLSISKKGADVGITSAITANDGGLQLYYYDRLERNLRTAWTTPHGWEFVNLDGDHGSFGGEEADSGIHAGTTIFFGSQQVYYYNRTTGALRHAWTDSSGWRFEDLGPTVIY